MMIGEHFYNNKARRKRKDKSDTVDNEEFSNYPKNLKDNPKEEDSDSDL